MEDLLHKGFDLRISELNMMNSRRVMDEHKILGLLLLTQDEEELHQNKFYLEMRAMEKEIRLLDPEIKIMIVDGFIFADQFDLDFSVRSGGAW